MPLSDLRPFSVHARHIDHHHARVLHEASFEAAAVAYIEEFHLPATLDGSVQVIVREVGTSHQQCFVIDPETGESTACG